MKLTPTGFEALAEHDPDSALRLLAEANDHLEPIVERNEAAHRGHVDPADGGNGFGHSSGSTPKTSSKLVHLTKPQ